MFERKKQAGKIYFLPIDQITFSIINCINSIIILSENCF